MRTRTTLLALGAAGLLLAVAGCADDADEPDQPDEVSEDPDEVLTEEDQEAMDDIDPDSGEDDVIEDATGVGLGVQPACVEPGEDLTVSAEGVEADTEHVLRIDPEPASPDVLEPSVLARSDDGGTIEVDLTLPEDDIDTGTYTMELLAAEDGQAHGEPLIATDFEIADTCTT